MYVVLILIQKTANWRIQTTGNYPGRASSYQQLMDDIDMVLKLIPGKPEAESSCFLCYFEDSNGQIEINFSQSILINGWISVKKENWGVILIPRSSRMKNVIH